MPSDFYTIKICVYINIYIYSLTVNNSNLYLVMLSYFRSFGEDVEVRLPGATEQRRIQSQRSVSVTSGCKRKKKSERQRRFRGDRLQTSTPGGPAAALRRRRPPLLRVHATRQPMKRHRGIEVKDA